MRFKFETEWCGRHYSIVVEPFVSMFPGLGSDGSYCYRVQKSGDYKSLKDYPDAVAKIGTAMVEVANAARMEATVTA